MTKGTDTWAAGDVDVQACLWLPALEASVAQRWQRVLDWWLGIMGDYDKCAVPASAYPVQKTRDCIKMAAYNHA